MPVNVEIKASVNDIEKLKLKAEELSQSQGEAMQQEDTFFNVPNGRLKLRQLIDAPSQLIYYERSDEDGPKTSDYHITEVPNPESLRTTLDKALGIKGTVKKTRLIYMVGQTRIHVDQVEGLGSFMELEVVMNPGQAVEEGQQIADDLMQKLGVSNDDLISCAYMDLLSKLKK